MEVEDCSLNTKKSPYTFLLLRDIRKYIESMSRRKFSLKIRTYGINNALMTKYFCLSKVTEFTLYASNNGAWRTLGRINGPARILRVQYNINQLAGVLSRMVNLQKFFWNCARYERYPDNSGSPVPEISEQLENLQRVFLELRCLYSLVIDGFIFDPHFFLRPPKGLREFRILWAMGQEWWKQFAKHPFVGLRTLFLHVETDQFFDPAEDVCSDNSFTLGCVSVSGLRSFKIFGRSKLPIDLEDYIVRNNPNLDEDSFRHICYRRGASIAAKCFWKIDNRALAAAKILGSSLPGQYATGDDTADSLNSKAAKEYSRAFVSAKVPSEIMLRSDIWMDTEEKVRKELISRIKLCTQYTSCRYSLEAIHSDEGNFLEDTLKAMQEFSGLLSKHSFTAGDWESTALDIKRAAHKPLNIMTRILNGMAPQCAETFGDLLRRGHRVDMEDIVKEWIPKLVKMYEEDQEHNTGDVITIRDAQVPQGIPIYNLSEWIADVFYRSHYYW
ncbi:hypothetical protein TWF173_005837 [Orbilia oligospora]|nr:hypothetical protein TWF173_005837 [Orbilia oligospora]